jgi:hypothetical protein
LGTYRNCCAMSLLALSVASQSLKVQVHHWRNLGQSMADRGGEPTVRTQKGERRVVAVRAQKPPSAHPFCCALISSYLASARTHTSSNSHIESMISRKVADVLARSALPKANMLLLRKYPMIRGSEIL